MEQQSEEVTFSSGVRKPLQKLLHRELLSWHIWKRFAANWGREKGAKAEGGGGGGL